MSILGGLTTDYNEDTGSFIVGSIIAKGVYAINDINELYNPVDFTVGTNGAINFMVGTYTKPKDVDFKSLSLVEYYKGNEGIYNFQVYGSNAIALSPADDNTTVYIGDAVFYSDTDYVYLTSFTKKLALMTDEIELGGSLHSLQDLKVEGEVYTPEINITKQINDNTNDLLGYAFRINTYNNLELIKYVSTESTESNAAQLVATFGKGGIVNDPFYASNINRYSSSKNTESELIGNNELVSPGTNITNSYNVSTTSQNGVNYFIFNDNINELNPSIEGFVGETFEFNLEVDDHPFWVKSFRGSQDTGAVVEDITNNGSSDSGIVVSWTPTSAGTYYYQCGTHHESMFGTIIISQNSGLPSTDKSYWLANGNDIYFGTEGGTVQRVGINTRNPEHPLHVIGTIQGTHFSDGVLSITNGFIENIQSISVESRGQYKGIRFQNIDVDHDGSLIDHYWNGHASNLYQLDKIPLSYFLNDMNLNDFYTSSNETWFDNPQEMIRLSMFSNDILDFGGDVTFCNCTVTETLIASNASINILAASNAVFSNVSMQDIDVNVINVAETITVPVINSGDIILSNSLSVHETIVTSNIVVNDVHINDNVTTSVLNVTDQINADTITAYIDKVITDEVNTRIAKINDTLEVYQLYADRVVSHLIPNSDSVYDLGSGFRKWRDLYLSGNTLNIDDMALKVHGDENAKTLNIQGGSLSTESISFQDGTTMASINDIVASVAEGEYFGDFSSFSMILNTTRNTVELFSGSFTYSINHNIAINGNEWIIQEFTENDVLPIAPDGLGVNTTFRTIIKRGGLPKDVQLSFIHKNKFLGNNIFFSHSTETNPNSMYPLRNLDPFSNFFKNKCKADYFYFYNLKEIEDGNKAKGNTIYSTNDKVNPYIQINSVNDFNSKNTGNKFYDIEFIYYHDVPLYESKYIVDDMSNRYLISNDPTVRLSQAYVFDTDADTYILKEIDSTYGLYPKIAIQKWDNSVNNTEFNEVIYLNSMGWGLPDAPTAFARFMDNGWIKQLFILTYKYIVYGSIISSVTDNILLDVDTHVNNLTYNDIVFIKENNIVDSHNVEIENNTIFCLKKSVFEIFLQ